MKPKNTAILGAGSLLEKRVLFPLVAPMLMVLAIPACAQTLPYQDTKAPLETRVNDLMSRMTPDERISLLTGTDFTARGVPRLGVPVMPFADAGQGVRGGPGNTVGPATAFPSGVAMASTWNPTLVGQVAAAIGVEAQNKGDGVRIMLGPAVNIQRSPLGGRNGEYFSEDPYLAGQLAVGYIKGMQTTGTGACIKHFAANNEEVDRGEVNVKVSERALREIYWPAFEAGVKDGGVWSVMSSYNRVNGPHSSADRYMLTDVLKGDWGFTGMVMSDWGGVHDTVNTINAGNDLEMPGPGLLTPDKVKLALQRGQVTQAQIDENVRRTIRTIFRTGLMDGTRTPNHALVNSDAHRQVALDAALEGLVLLKNQGNILPLDATKIHSIALIGPAARQMQVGAAGSPEVQPLRQVGPVDGITARLGAGVTVRTASGETNGSTFPAGTVAVPQGTEPGFKAEYFANRNLQGTPAVTRTEAQVDMRTPPAGVGPNDWSARFTTTLTPSKSGLTTFIFRADDGCRVFIDGKRIIDQWHEGGATNYSGTADLKAGQKYELRAEYYQGGGDQVAQLTWAEPGAEMYTAVKDAARQSDVAIVFVTTRGTEGEGTDRPSMALPNNQDELIRQVTAANKRTIVVLNNGTPVLMPWLSQTPALLEAWFPGQEGGTALAKVLFGDVNPSGHLPTTLGARREDYPDYGNFPGVKNTVKYEEGIYVGYRSFDKKNIAPLFPFGYGLSYTTFRIDNLKLSSPTLAADGTLTANVRVTNTGKRAGAEVVQLYVHDNAPKVDKAVRELKGFAKVMLQPGQSQMVALQLKPRDFAYCDVAGKGWRADAGSYEISVGDSSRNLTQKATVRLAAYFERLPNLVDSGAPKPVVAGDDLAFGKKATASSVNNPDNTPDLALDNDDGTRWQAQNADNQWLAVDLGKQQHIGRVHLSWERAYASQYRIEVSNDGQNWTPVFTTDKGIGDLEDISFAPVDARYVRIFCVNRVLNYGASLYSFEVRAPK